MSWKPSGMSYVSTVTYNWRDKLSRQKSHDIEPTSLIHSGFVRRESSPHVLCRAMAAEGAGPLNAS